MQELWKTEFADRCRAGFEAAFGYAPRALYSSPGRTEIGGNHTDHQRGCVLAASVDMETDAAVAPRTDSLVRVQSEGYPLVQIDLSDLSVHPEETGNTAALVRGVAARIAELGHPVVGFDAYMVSNVLAGSGLSSSAAFEVLLASIFSDLGGCGFSAVELAQISQWTENVFFGKPCGLMDQMACAVGGAVGIDFADPQHPVVTPVQVDLEREGYALCIVDSGADHADLTADYASIPEDMGRVATHLGHDVLREVDEAEFMARLPELRVKCGDRAVLRSMHFFSDNRCAAEELHALERGDFSAFLALVRSSGHSSWEKLQNVIPTGRIAHQEMAFALALAEQLLDGTGAVRVHGGGFAGTIQAFVPLDRLEPFRRGIEAALGEGSCYVLSIRPYGSRKVAEY